MRIVASHAKIWIPLGITIMKLAAEKNVIEICGKPRGEHVVDPHAEADDPGHHGRQGEPLVADDRAPGERGHDRGHDPDGGQEDDVDVRVSEDPEEVLPEQRIASVRGLEEVEAPVALELEQRVRDRQRLAARR